MCFFVSLSIFVLFLSRHSHSVPYSPDAKLPRWGYLKPFVALSLDRVFRGCFARVFTFLLILLLFIYSFHFVCLFGKPGVCSSLFFPFCFFLLFIFFGFSLPTSVLRRVIFIRRMISLGPGASIGLTGKVNAQVLRPLYPRQR